MTGDGNPTMATHRIEFKRQIIFWLASLAVFVVLLWLLSEILLPFVAGWALAYLQVPLVDRLERIGLSRTVAALIIVGVALAVLMAVLLLVVPIVIEQLTALVTSIPSYIVRLQHLISEIEWLRPLLGDSGSGKVFEKLIGQNAGWMTALLATAWTGGKALLSFLSLIIVMPIVTFYLLVDWHNMVRILDGWLPRQHRETIHALVRETDHVMGGFVRGQLIVCVILTIFYSVAFTLVGLNFGWVIGIVAGIMTFIPYVGTVTALVLSLSVAIAQFWPEWMMILAVLMISLAGEFIEGNILVPKLVGEHVGLHPVLLILAMFSFGYLYGIVGLIVAVPVAAIIGVLFRFAIRQYLASPYYSGVTPD
jgi:predicted PurR-regulated permease PerM